MQPQRRWKRNRYKKTWPHNEDSRPLFFFLLPEKEKKKRKTKKHKPALLRLCIREQGKESFFFLFLLQKQDKNILSLLFLYPLEAKSKRKMEKTLSPSPPFSSPSIRERKVKAEKRNEIVAGTRQEARRKGRHRSLLSVFPILMKSLFFFSRMV